MPSSPLIAPAAPSPLSPAEMELLLARTGLTLNPGQMADLVLAWRQLAGLIGAIPRSAALADDQAFVFRLPGPAAPPAPRSATRPAPAKPKATARKAAAKKPAAKKSGVRKKPARKR
jgi:hypothetical protein